MDFKLTKEQALIQKMARTFAEKAIEPLAEQIDRENQLPEAILKGMAELDFFGLPFSESYGGRMPVMMAMY